MNEDDEHMHLAVEMTKQVKAASDIVDVLRRYISLRRFGPVFKGKCPHCKHRPDTLDADPRRQRYRCWACGKNGDCITFVERAEGIGFREARAKLAGWAGIDLQGTD